MSSATDLGAVAASLSGAAESYDFSDRGDEVETEEGRRASGSGAAKSWVVMEKVLAQLPNRGRDLAQLSRYARGLHSPETEGTAGEAADADAIDNETEVAFCEELYSNGRVVGKLTGVLRLLDLPTIEQQHHGTLTENGISFTGPVAIGEVGLSVSGEAARPTGEVGAGRAGDEAFRLGPLHALLTRALNQGDEAGRRETTASLCDLLRVSHKDSLVCFVYRDVAALHGSRTVMLALWGQALSGLESKTLGFAALADCYMLITLLLKRAEIGATLHDSSSGGVGRTPLAHVMHWRTLQQRTLAWVLYTVGEPPPGGDGPALRDFCSVVVASAFFRLPQFGLALLTALQVS